MTEYNPSKRNGRYQSEDIRDTLVDRYFHEIEHFSGLSPEDEFILYERIQEGDVEARNELVIANLRFVVSVAKDYQNLGVPLIDLISAGNLKLITAAERFDGTKGFKFISYAVWWVRQGILQALAEQNKIVRLPLNRIGELTKINKIVRRLGQKSLSQEEVYKTIAEELELKDEQIEYLREISQNTVSLHKPIKDEDGEDRTLIDILEDESQISPDITVGEDELKGEISAQLSKLPEREARVLRMYYGLNGHKPMTLEEIGRYMGRTRERVRQIREKALHKLRHPSRLNALKEHCQE